MNSGIARVPCALGQEILTPPPPPTKQQGFNEKKREKKRGNKNALCFRIELC